MKKKILKIILAILIVFAAYNVIWFAWSHLKYGKLSGGMEKMAFSTFITPRYSYTDADGYNYPMLCQKKTKILYRGTATTSGTCL